MRRGLALAPLLHTALPSLSEPQTPGWGEERAALSHLSQRAGVGERDDFRVPERTQPATVASPVRATPSSLFSPQLLQDLGEQH